MQEHLNAVDSRYHIVQYNRSVWSFTLLPLISQTQSCSEIQNMHSTARFVTSEAPSSVAADIRNIIGSGGGISLAQVDAVLREGNVDIC